MRLKEFEAATEEKKIIKKQKKNRTFILVQISQAKYDMKWNESISINKEVFESRYLMSPKFGQAALLNQQRHIRSV